MLIWRPIAARLVSLTEVKSGSVTLVDLMKLNAILDSQAAAAAVPPKS